MHEVLEGLTTLALLVGSYASAYDVWVWIEEWRK